VRKQLLLLAALPGPLLAQALEGTWRGVLRVLDRPVIDQSGLTDRFDFTLNWTPDEFQFPRASAAQRAAVPTNPDAPPDLFTAFQEQLGMKLEAKKAPADIVVIYKASKPSEN
jgi:bla regulator protein blaR1